MLEEEEEGGEGEEDGICKSPPLFFSFFRFLFFMFFLLALGLVENKRGMLASVLLADNI